MSRSAILRLVETPLGPMSAEVVDGRLASLRFDPAFAAGPPEAGDPKLFHHLVEQLAAYFAGGGVGFDLPLAERGTPFQGRVWGMVAAIPWGETRSYGELARSLGTPGAARAVGLANGANPWHVVVPCHRVVGGDGALRGYAGGRERKRRLLALEGGAGRLEDLESG